MRGALGLVGLLLAVLMVGLLVRKQMAVSLPAQSAQQVPAGWTAGTASAPSVNSTANPQQVQQQVKQALDAALQTRPMPDDQ